MQCKVLHMLAHRPTHVYTQHAHKTQKSLKSNVLIKIDLKVNSELKVRISGFGFERSKNPAGVLNLKPHPREKNWWKPARTQAGGGQT